ncbi:CAZyme family GT34 [Aspergillus niger]|nr:CAZyme family GT34 [Aspergillus niger]KAI2918025.1 CAZyme family GT34 [Aspergillus niger]KAI2938877.1 CAZyme family GT34 [Aspergillus niger]KAI2975195.1 CAZyme family GT34 [Aspergillus niger]KAI2977509.1 CAZyme family GT34 [Aspergillus niger]
MFSRFRAPHVVPVSEPEYNPIVRKVTMVYGNRTAYYRGLETHENHARRFGYPMTVLRKPILGGFWSKPAILLSTIIEELEKPDDERVEWLFWFDGDTVLMNPNMPLEVFLPPPQFPDTHLLIAKDWNGMNNGVFFIRVCQWSAEFLSATLAYPSVHPETGLFWADQSAMDKLNNELEHFTRSIVFTPLRWFNAYMRSPNAIDINPDSPAHLQVHPGDLLVHFPGTAAESLDTTMGPYLELAESHNPDWELPVEKTSYFKETADFWYAKHEEMYGKPLEPSPTADSDST